MTDFITKFHNLDGDLKGERKKSLSKLLKDTSLNLNQLDIDNAIQNINPKTYQEKLFWVETLIYFKKTASLLELLKQGNREYIKIIIRQNWFIEEAFKNITAKELVDEFFPCVSYTTRLKLIRKISGCWSEEKVDDLFDAIEKRYGFYIAKDVLHVCSVSKIRNILKENEVVLSTYQVIQLFNRNEDLIKIYLNHIQNIFKNPFTKQNVLNLIAFKNPILFLQLLDSNIISTKKLPTAATKKIINFAKQDIINKPKYYFKILNTRTLVAELGSDVKTFFKGFFHSEFQEINSNCDSIKLLIYVPKNIRWNLFCEAYKINFPHRTIEELFINLDSTILKLNPNKDVIQNWAEVNYKATNDETFFKYYSTLLSIPMLMEKINVTSDKVKRKALLLLLISACAENKDMAALDKVLKYIASRHKNEDPYTYHKLISFVCETFNKGELTKQHWDFIYKQVILIRTVGTVSFYEYKEIFGKILGYAYKNDKELFKTVAAEYIKEGADSLQYFRISLQDSDLERDIFREFCELFPTVVISDHKNFQLCQSNLIHQFFDICDNHPKHCLNLLEFPYLVTAIETVTNKVKFDSADEEILSAALPYHFNFPEFSLPFLNESKIIEILVTLLNSDQIYTCCNIVTCIVKKKTLFETGHNIVVYFLEQMDISKISSWFFESIVEWLILYHPKLLVSNCEKVYSRLDPYCYKKELKEYSHLGLDNEICEYLEKNCLQTDRDQRKKTLNILQNLLPEEKFIEFIHKHFDPDKPLEETPNDLMTLEIQYHIVNLLKNGKDPLKFLELILKFCKRDYLQYALPSLYSLFSRSPENMIYHYLEILSQKDMSARKHAVFLSCQLLDCNYIFNVLKNADSTLHPLRKHLCLATLKYFIKNSSEQLFILVKKYLEMIDESGKDKFSTLIKVKIPKKYRASYIEICWKIFENMVDEKLKLQCFDKLLEQLFDEYVLKSVSPSFVNDVLTNYLPVQSKKRLTNIDQFAVSCLAYTETSNNSLIVVQLSKLNKQTIRNFSAILVDFIHNKKTESKFLVPFVDNWSKNFSIIDSLDEYIIFNLLLKFSNYSLEDCAKSIIDYLDHMIYELGPQVFEIFKNNLEKLINKMNKLDQYLLFQLILNYKCSTVVCVLVIQLLTSVHKEESEELRNAYNKITQVIYTINEPIVKCIFEIYLRQVEV